MRCDAFVYITWRLTFVGKILIGLTSEISFLIADLLTYAEERNQVPRKRSIGSIVQCVWCCEASC